MEFKQSVITEKGKALLAKAEVGVCSMIFTRAAVGDGQYQPETLMQLTEAKQLRSEKNTFHFSGTAEITADDQVLLTTIVRNHETEVGYYLLEYGIFATDPDEGEILYALSVATPDKADWIPPFRTGGAVNITIRTYLAIGTASDITIQESSFDYVSQANFAKHSHAGTAMLTDVEKVSQELEQLESEVSVIKTDVDGLNDRVDNLVNMGSYVGSFQTYAKMPQNSSGFSDGITINDFATIKADENQGGATTRYIVRAVNPSTGQITWSYDMTYSTDITGKANIVAGAVAGHLAGLDNKGNLIDSGKQATDFATASQGQKADNALQSPNGVLGTTIVNNSAYAKSYAEDIFGAASLSGSGYFFRAIRSQATAPPALLPGYSSGIAWKSSDTYGSLMVSWNTDKIARITGGNGTNPTWTADLLHTLNYKNYVPSLVSGAVAGNFAGLMANGNMVDSGKKASDFLAANAPAGGDLSGNYPNPKINEDQFRRYSKTFNVSTSSSSPWGIELMYFDINNGSNTGQGIVIEIDWMSAFWGGQARGLTKLVTNFSCNAAAGATTAMVIGGSYRYGGANGTFAYRLDGNRCYLYLLRSAGNSIAGTVNIKAEPYSGVSNITYTGSVLTTQPANAISYESFTLPLGGTAAQYVNGLGNVATLDAAAVKLGNVPNVTTNDQTPSYTTADSNTNLISGEKLSAAFGKISRAITSLISHLADSVSHVTATERSTWNAKQNALTIDSALSSTSTNPLQNKAAYAGLAGKSDTSHTHHSTTSPKMSGTAAVGTETVYARGDHIHPTDTSRAALSHTHTNSQVGLSNVPNVATNDQTPNFTMADSTTNLTSGEKLSVGFGKIAKAIASLISHLADSVSHVTAAERSTWNAKQNALTIDSALSSTSANPLQNKVVNTALSGKANTTHTHDTSKLWSMVTVTITQIAVASGTELKGSKEFIPPSGYTPVAIAEFTSNSTFLNVAKLQLNGNNVDYNFFNNRSATVTVTPSIVVLCLKSSI